ncbi:hypothetical protein PL335_06235 [Sulfitobacter faviae]|uniref:hypothetical protein n=1 Tax=Sulfitobacter faviae TaxID=1775881 RepID=UPI002307028A|nr:hypothetical protein [Sulfitobacter faviae]WCE67941.1 hypothetical protein PL335_06235 [Sulfitobacter faviae]
MMITQSSPSPEVQRQERQQSPKSRALPVHMFIAGLALSLAGLLGGHFAAKGIANAAHFNAKNFIEGAFE